MTFGTIQFGGLASGLDTQAIIDAILAVEQIPILQLQERQAEHEQSLSLIGTLEGELKELQAKAEALGTSSGVLAKTSSVSQEGFLEVEVDGDAAVGSHSVAVNSLASADSFAFDPVADPAADLGAIEVSFDYDGQTYVVPSAGGSVTLDSLAAAINAEAGDAVTASVVNTGTDASPAHRLVITGDDTGADFQITNLQALDQASGQPATTLTNPTELTNATNAEIVVDGLVVQRSTNEFQDVLPGVTITALATTSASLNLTVSRDDEAVIGRVQEFVDAYNAVIGFINEQGELDEEGTATSPLFGDSLLSTVRQRISSAIFDVPLADVQADTEGYSTLSLVGIDVQSDGTLEIDEAQLSEKLEADPELFADLFADTDGFDNAGAAPGTSGYYVDTTADSGLASTLAREIDRLLDEVVLADGSTLPGLIDSREETIQGEIDRLDDEIERLEDHVEQVEADLIARFTALEELLAGLQSQQSFLASQPFQGTQ